MGRKYGMLDIDKKYTGFSCDYSEQTGRLLAEIFDGYIKDGYKISVDMDGETVDIRQYHGHFKHDFESAFAKDEDGEDGFEWCLYDFQIISTKPFIFIADRMKFIPYLERVK